MNEFVCTTQSDSTNVLAIDLKISVSIASCEIELSVNLNIFLIHRIARYLIIFFGGYTCDSIAVCRIVCSSIRHERVSRHKPYLKHVAD